jgi:hypothetical protein
MKLIKWMIAGALGVFLVSTNPAVNQAQDNGNGHGKGHNKHDRDDDDEHSDHYFKHHDAPDCVNVVIGGHVVLNHRTNVVVDIFHFDVN